MPTPESKAAGSPLPELTIDFRHRHTGFEIWAALLRDERPASANDGQRRTSAGLAQRTAESRHGGPKHDDGRRNERGVGGNVCRRAGAAVVPAT
jgi:hypothetical protein